MSNNPAEVKTDRQLTVAMSIDIALLWAALCCCTRPAAFANLAPGLHCSSEVLQVPVQPRTASAEASLNQWCIQAPVLSVHAQAVLKQHPSSTQAAFKQHSSSTQAACTQQARVKF